MHRAGRGFALIRGPGSIPFGWVRGPARGFVRGDTFFLERDQQSHDLLITAILAREGICGRAIHLIRSGGVGARRALDDPASRVRACLWWGLLGVMRLCLLCFFGATRPTGPPSARRWC